MIVEHAILIDAPLETVWATTVDVERWPDWTPTVTTVRKLTDAPFGMGSRVEIKQPGQPVSQWVVTAFEPDQHFTWTTERTGLRMTATHELSTAAEGTRSTLRLEASGFLATLLGPFLKPMIRQALAQENEGLKRHCKALAQAT